MGKGIAKDIRNRWPRMYDEYRRRCKNGHFVLGDVFVWEEEGIVIFNLGTQRSWKTNAELPAIRKSLQTTVGLAKERGLDAIGLPKIGAGLGGLEWQEVKKFLQQLGDSTTVRLVVFEEYESGMAASFHAPEPNRNNETNDEHSRPSTS